MGADAIKFQTRNNKTLFSEEAYNKNITAIMLLLKNMENTEKNSSLNTKT